MLRIRICLVLMASLAAEAVWPQTDTDDDGLPDVVELLGYTENGVYVNMPGLGADPHRKNTFVEIDTMTGITVPAGGFQDVIDSFADAPVLNPDHSTGIDLYIDASGSVPFAEDISFSSSGEGNRLVPRVDMNAAGGFAVIWQDDRDDNGLHQILARRFSADGSAATGEFTVNKTGAGEQRVPDIAVNASGRMAAAWMDDNDGNGYYNVFARTFAANARSPSDEITVHSNLAGQQTTPSIAMDDSANFIVVWADDRDGNGYYQILSRRFDMDGVALANEVTVNPVADGQQRDPEIAMRADGQGSVVVWADDRDGNGYYEIFAQRLNANGARTGSEIHVNQVSDGNQKDPRVAMNASGDFVVVWADDRDGNGYWEIYGRRFNANGSANGGEFKVNATSDGQQFNPAVGMGDNGRFTVAWQDDNDGNGYYQIFARTFNSDGSPRTGEVTVNTQASGNQTRAAVAMSTDYVVAYEDDRNTDGNMAIFRRVLTDTASSVSDDAEVHFGTTYFFNLKSSHFTDSRKPWWHYGVIAKHRTNTGSSGVANGNGFVVSLGITPNRGPFAGTVMHEFGHTIGLGHGGDEGKNYKPNYRSVMNYLYQFRGVDDDCDGKTVSGTTGPLDFSDGRMFSLNELNLDERIGVCNGETPVNWMYEGTERDVDLDVSDSGSFVAAWEDDRDGNGYYEIFARAFDSSGAPITGKDRHVNSSTSFTQRNPAIAIADNGSFLVVWGDDSNDNGLWQIHGQRYNSASNRLGGQFTINADASGDQRYPDVARAGDGHSIVVWEDDRDGNGYYEIYGRSFNANGSPATGDVHINQTSDGQQLRPRVSMADDHSAVVVWQDDRDGNGYFEIYGRRLGTNGGVFGNEFHVNAVSTGQQRNPDVAIAADGRFVVVWQGDQAQAGNYDIFARRYNNNATPTGSEVRVNNNASGQQRLPRVAVNDNFAWAVGWEDDTDGNGYYQIRSRAYSNFGSATSTERTVNPLADGDQRRPDIGVDQAGQIYVAWQDDRNDVGFWNIYASRLMSTLVWLDRVAIDWDGDSNIGTGVEYDVNDDDEKNTLDDHDDWGNVDLTPPGG